MPVSFLPVQFREVQLYVDGTLAANLMNGEQVVFYLNPGVHRLGVSTQFDPVRELPFGVSADARYTNLAAVSFNRGHRVLLQRVAR
ncbi:hypothetical protein QS306_08005 [Paraburkholderia bonniea]|uniref:hypothetical protein n=1 Tax=Paraburkholderia bonniea TaxID=2152891 RepID=UPI0025740719|nr:hypothetical protein [Paraburkholderia bonniea]WJF89085.1 hypothetical protein QS306_08005 [Paraburkholderia bonniea]WJF92401.1 hypothetical protein QS308_08015 [Paraburkholderia bonniea]